MQVSTVFNYEKKSVMILKQQKKSLFSLCSVKLQNVLVHILCSFVFWSCSQKTVSVIEYA